MNRFLCLLSFVLVPFALLAQGTSTGSSHLKLPLEARAASLAEAPVSDAGEFSSWLINPANLATTGSLAVQLTHSLWIQEVQSDYLGVRIPSSWGTFAVAVSSTSVPGIEIREIPGPSVGTFSARFATIQAGFAGELVGNLAAGATFKYLYEKMYSDNATGVGIDLGFLYRTPLSGLQAAISVTNAGSLEQFRNERTDLPTFLRVGATYSVGVQDLTFSGSTAFAHNLQVSEQHVQFAAEATYNNLFAIRAGYETGYDSRGLTAGLGVRYHFIQLDYAYVPFSLGLGNGHLFSLGFQF